VTHGNDYSFVQAQVKKEQVDRYSDGRRIPSCQISVHWAGIEQKEKAVRSFHKVTLKGTREPSFFQIECKPISTSKWMR